MSDLTHHHRLLHRLQAPNIAVSRPTFVWLAAMLGVLSLSLSALTVTSRAKLWFGPQTLILGGVGLAMACMIALLSVSLSRARGGYLLDRPALSRRGVWLVIVACLLTSFAILFFAFATFANSADEYGYLFQAATFRHLRLWNAEPIDPELFGQNLTVMRDGIWVSQYLPFWPAVLALFELVGLPPWLAAPACGAGLLLLLWTALRSECRSPAMTIALLLAYATSGFFLLNGATYFSHCASALIVVGSIVCMLRAFRDAAWYWPCAVGGCFGLALLCRIDSAALVASAALLGWIEQGCLRRTLLLGIAGAIPPVLLFLGYNWAVTGEPLLPPTAWAGIIALGENGLQGVESGPHLRMVVQTLWRLGELADTASLLVPALYAAAIVIRFRTRSLRFYDIVPAVNLLVFLIYPDNGGFQMGPRYWFDGFVIMHITVGSVFSRQPIVWQRFATMCCLLLVPVSLARLPAQIGFQARVMHERATVFRLGHALPADRRSVVLVDDFRSLWNERADRTAPNFAKDFARNGLRLDRPVLYARADVPDAPQRACANFPGADVFAFHLDQAHPDGWLEPLRCPGQAR